MGQNCGLTTRDRRRRHPARRLKNPRLLIMIIQKRLSHLKQPVFTNVCVQTLSYCRFSAAVFLYLLREQEKAAKLRAQAMAEAVRLHQSGSETEGFSLVPKLRRDSFFRNSLGVILVKR